MSTSNGNSEDTKRMVVAPSFFSKSYSMPSSSRWHRFHLMLTVIAVAITAFAAGAWTPWFLISCSAFIASIWIGLRTIHSKGWLQASDELMPIMTRQAQMLDFVLGALRQAAETATSRTTPQHRIDQ